MSRQSHSEENSCLVLDCQHQYRSPPKLQCPTSQKQLLQFISSSIHSAHALGTRIWGLLWPHPETVECHGQVLRAVIPLTRTNPESTMQAGHLRFCQSAREHHNAGPPNFLASRVDFLTMPPLQTLATRLKSQVDRRCGQRSINVHRRGKRCHLARSTARTSQQIRLPSSK